MGKNKKNTWGLGLGNWHWDIGTFDMFCYDSFEIFSWFSCIASLVYYLSFDYFWKENLVLAVAKKKLLTIMMMVISSKNVFLHQDDAQKTQFA